MAQYCPDCGGVVGDTDNYCADCGFRLSEAPDLHTPGKTPPSMSPGRWYVGVAFPLIVTAVMVIVSFSIGFLEGAGALQPAVTDGWVDVVGALWSLAMLFSIAIAPLSVYFDRRNLTRAGGWAPSRAYYLAVIPGLNILLAVPYLWQRHRSRTVESSRPTEPPPDAGPSP